MRNHEGQTEQKVAWPVPQEREAVTKENERVAQNEFREFDEYFQIQ
jgi:hypothetical protein